MRANIRHRRRERGEIEALPSGSLRVKAYAGVDAIAIVRSPVVA
jgi:hypothetical protein